MTDPITIKIILGLILWNVGVVFIAAIGLIHKKKLDEMTTNRKIGETMYGLFLLVWWLYLVHYWITLYFEAVTN